MTSSPVETRRYTIYDLAAFPDDDKRRELADGRIVEWEMPDQEHAELLALLTIVLGTHVRAHRLGVVSSGDGFVRIQGSVHDARGGDVEFFGRGRAPRDVRAPATTTVPDFVIEILSPSDRRAEVAAKVQDWLRAGVRLLWYVNPETGTTIVHNQAGARRVIATEPLDGGDVLPGLQLRLQDLLDQLETEDD